MMKNKYKKIIKVVTATITAVITALVCYMLLCNVIAVREEKPVSYFGYSYSYVPTKSMEPTIKAGDSIIFTKVKYDDLKVGDIIIYKSKEGDTKGLYIVHRIIEQTDEGFITKGDNNQSADSEIITADMLIGKYKKTFNFLNIGKIALKKNLIYLILIIFFVVIILFEAVNIYLSKQKKNLNDINKKNELLKEEVLKEMKEEILKEISKKDE